MDKLQLKLDNAMQPLEKYSRMAAYRTTQYANSTSHKHHQKWDAMFPDEYIDWPTLRTHPTNSPNLINLRFSLMHGAIRIGSQARHWMKDADLSCPSCKQKCNDVHLFLECPTSVQAWKHVEDFWASLQSKHPILENYQVKKSYKLFGPPMVTTKNSIEHNIYSFLDSFIGHMQTAIWNAYCSRVHSSIEYTASTIIEIYNSKISRSLHHFLHSMKQNSYVPSRWGCPKLTIEQIAKISSQPNWKKAYASLLRAAAPTASREPAAETPHPDKNGQTPTAKRSPKDTRQSQQKEKHSIRRKIRSAKKRQCRQGRKKAQSRNQRRKNIWKKDTEQRRSQAWTQPKGKRQKHTHGGIPGGGAVTVARAVAAIGPRP